MSNFFDSELIQEELQEINDLQDQIYYTVMDFGILSREQKLEHIEKLKVLLEKQRIMYTRLCLTDDPEARELKKRIQDSIVLMGFSPETDMNSFFESVSKTIESLKKNIDD
jgi:hypothetical protein